MITDQLLAACRDSIAKEQHLRAQLDQASKLVGEQLALARAAGISVRSIARKVDLPKSTVDDRSRPFLQPAGAGS